MKIIKGDITKLAVECIVNAANTSLLGGGGVDGAIHKAGGTAILEACRAIRNKQGGCKVGEAVITTAGLLKANYVIHTVGPVWNGGTKNEEELLANCYKNSIALAVKHGITELVFPNISTGIYKFPKNKAAEIAIQTVKEYSKGIRIVFVCFDDENYQIYQDKLNNA